MPTLVLSERAEKDFSKLQKTERQKVDKKLKAIKAAPYSGKSLKGELKEFFSIQAWPYRIIYSFDKRAKRITIHKIRHRKEVYKN